MAAPTQNPGDPDTPSLDVLRKICEISPSSILVTDAAGIIEYVNPAFERLNGYTSAEVLGKKPHLLKSDAHPPEFYADLWKTISSGNTWAGRLRNRRKDGSLYWTDLTITSVRDKDGQIARYIAAGNNVAQAMVAGDAAPQFFDQPMTLNMITSSDGVIRLINGAWRRVLGYGEGELDGKPFMDLIHPDDHKATLQQMGKLAEGAEVLGFENRYRSKSGDYRTLLWAARASSENGFIYATAIDTTERRRIEEDLKAGDARFRAFFELPLNGRCITSVEKGWIAVNDRLCEMLGYTREELIGKTWSEMTHPGDLAADLLQFNRMLSGECDQYRLEKRFIRKDGSVIWTEIIVGCIRKSDVSVDYVVCVIDDITERKRVAQELALTADRLQLATKAGGVGIWDYDAVNNVFTWDDQMFALYGTTRDAFDGSYAAWTSRVHPDDRERADSAMKQALDGVENFNTEFRVSGSGGCIRYIRALATVERSSAGKPLRVIGTNWDVTVRKILENDLNFALKRAEAAARAKSDFLAVMSHELRTPLNGVLGFLELLMHTPLGEEQKVYAETIRESGEHLLAIVNDILDFSSFERGVVSLQQSPLALVQIVDASGRFIREAAAAKGLEFRCDIASGAPMEITGDERRIGQILNNLLANAVKFTARGSVALHVSPAEENGRPFLQFTVEDTGIGISSDTLAGLFRPFMQVDPSSRRSFGGIGLGLAISQRLAEAMGGSITVASTPQRGSTFTFHLPLEPAANTIMTTVSQSTSSPQPASVKNVLLVEDDDANSRLAGKMLELLGCHVDFALHGMAAIEAFAPGKYDAIFMDVRMPVMDGIEATAKIRAIEAPSGTRVPIIALTANAMPDDRELCIASGMDDFISKPFRKDELAAKLADINAPRS